SSAARRRGPRIIVRVGRIFWRALALGNVAQIDPDASPVGRSAAHRVDEDIVHVQPRRRFRIPDLPAFEPGERVRLTRRLGDGDEWLGGLTVAAAFSAGARGLPSRWRDARRLVTLLLIVRRPRRVSEAF